MNSSHAKRELKGDRNQCPSCGEFFNSTSAFEKHRKSSGWFIGIPTKEAKALGYPHRCLTVKEMQSEGMQKNSTTYWITSAFEKYSTKGN